MLYETYQKGSYHVIKFNKALTLNSDISELGNTVAEFLKKNITNIAIHFKDGSYLYSSTASVIVYCWKIIEHHNGSFALVNVNPDIYNFLTIIDLDSVFKICDSEEELEYIEQD